jgi:dethiobiotin synthetase
MSDRDLFITGTDTGVGKTVVTALLASCLARRGISVGVMKPVATGGEELAGMLRSPDAVFLREKLGLDDPLELINPVCFREPLAPSIAARREGREVDLAQLDAAYVSLKRRRDAVLIEGIGGLLVPIRGGFTVADLILRWDVPILIVARPGLGTINHTALTISHARSRGLRVAGFVMNASSPLAGDRAEEASPACIEELCDVRCWGSIPHAGGPPAELHAWERLCEEARPVLAPHLADFFMGNSGSPI